MRIAEINLQAFGPFTDRPLTFSEEDGLVVLYGPNEAGKSSMLRALKAWLYGIPAQSTDNFIHDHQKMRVGGRLCLSNGRELTFLRRKGNKKTILDLSGNPLDDGILDTFLSQVGEDAFSKMFGIDNEALVRGGKELLEDKGDVGQALFAAGMSGLQLRRVLQAIEKQANELFKSGGSKQEITEALKDLTEARKKIREECVSGKEINELEDRSHEAQALVARLDISLAEALTELSRFERLAGALPKLGKRTGILARLEAMRDVPILSEDFPERRREAQQDKKQATKDKAIYEPELERLAQQIEELSGAGGFASYAEKIESLLKRLGAHLKAQRDLVGLDAKHETCVQETQRLLAEIRPSLSFEDLGLLRVTEARKKRIRELALRRENAFSAETKCLDALTLITEKLEQAQQKLGGMPAGRDESELERTVDTLQRHGDLAKTVRAAQQEQQAFADEAKNTLARLGLWSGTLEDVERLPVPTQETIGRFQTDFDELAADRKALEKRLRDLDAERAGIEDEIEGMRRNVAVLTEVELVDARDRRDGTWRQIRGAWLDKEQLEEPASALAQGYEEEVKTADDAADTLRDNADQVAEHTERLRQLDRVQKKIVKDSAERDRIVKRQEQVEAEWAVAWSESGIKPLPPKEMQAWLNRHAQLLELGKRMREAGVEEREAVQEMAAGVEALHLCMQALGEAPCGPEETYGKTYGKLIERSKALVSSLRNMNNARAAAEKAVADIEKERRRAEKELGQAQAAWAQWQKDWAECMGWLELAPDTSINEADSHLERLDDLFKQAKDAADLADRIAGIKKDAKSLDAEVRTLVDAIAPDLKNSVVPEAIEELQRRSGNDKEAVTQRREYSKQQVEAKKRLDGAHSTLAEANRVLARLCQDAGCAEPEQLDQIEQKSTERRRLMAEIEQLEEALQEIAKGMPLEKLAEEASGVDGDALPALISSANERIESLRETKDQENRNIGQVTEKIAALQGRSGAARAAETAQEYLALIEEKSRQYIKLKLASIVSRAEVKKYQTINQGPLMARAGELFARLTLGSFASLSVGYSEKDEPYLLGVRPSEETVPVEGMSDGTRDQLYLSLRLATLEKFLDNSEPMPFIVDDILIRFDDERAKATLDVLAELAKKTQVLFFTHHARLFEFAQSTGMAGKVRALALQN